MHFVFPSDQIQTAKPDAFESRGTSVRHACESAKPLHLGSIPTAASKSFNYRHLKDE